ncbi:MAG: transposase, partial [Methanomicrobiales archaeon]|nr:transposase [Methanomicrobiales archaeon]
RRTKVIGAFPNDSSFLRVAVAILMDMNEEWVTGKRYLSMEER